jgi:hypothetical protein
LLNKSSKSWWWPDGRVVLEERGMYQSIDNVDTYTAPAEGIVHSTPLFDDGKVLPTKNVVSEGAELVQGPITPMISKELVIIENSWKVLNIHMNTSLSEKEWPSWSLFLISPMITHLPWWVQLLIQCNVPKALLMWKGMMRLGWRWRRQWLLRRGQGSIFTTVQVIWRPSWTKPSTV